MYNMNCLIQNVIKNVTQRSIPYEQWRRDARACALYIFCAFVSKTISYKDWMWQVNELRWNFYFV